MNILHFREFGNAEFFERCVHIVLFAMGLAMLVEVPIACVFIIGQFPELLEDSTHVLGNALGPIKQVVEGSPYNSAILGAAVFLAVLPLSLFAKHSVKNGPYSAMVNGELGVERSICLEIFVIV